MMNLGKKINDALTHHFGVQPLAQSQEDIARWLQTPLGQRVLASEQQLLNKIMPSMYGYHLMQLSVLPNSALSSLSPVTHHFSLGVTPETAVKAVTRFEQLPIDTESVDVAIIHHALEYSTHPHQLLRDTARTIIPNGYLIVVGFNPWSPLASKKLLGRIFTRRPHWRYHDLHRSRVVDWLQVLDFEPASLRYGYHGLPFNRGHRSRLEQFTRWLLPATGMFYIIVARKSVTPMTIIKKPWKETGPLPQWVKGGVVSNRPAASSAPRQTIQ